MLEHFVNTMRLKCLNNTQCHKKKKKKFKHSNCSKLLNSVSQYWKISNLKLYPPPHPKIKLMRSLFWNKIKSSWIHLLKSVGVIWTKVNSRIRLNFKQINLPLVNSQIIWKVFWSGTEVNQETVAKFRF